MQMYYLIEYQPHKGAKWQVIGHSDGALMPSATAQLPELFRRYGSGAYRIVRLTNGSRDVRLQAVFGDRAETSTIEDR